MECLYIIDTIQTLLSNLSEESLCKICKKYNSIVSKEDILYYIRKLLENEKENIQRIQNIFLNFFDIGCLDRCKHIYFNILDKINTNTDILKFPDMSPPLMNFMLRLDKEYILKLKREYNQPKNGYIFDDDWLITGSGFSY